MPCSSLPASSAVGAGLGAFLGDQVGIVPDRLAVACASRARRSSAAASRPDTTCPGRNAGSRPARSGRAAAGSACRPARASSARPRRCSIRRSRNRRSTRRSARRPWSGARRRPASSASTCWPSASSAAQLSSENGLVMRGCSATRCTFMSKSKSTSAQLADSRRRSARRCGNAAWRPAGYGFRRSAGPRSGRGRSSPRRAGRPRTQACRSVKS